MKIEEFEQIIADNAHKSDILRLVNNGIELAKYKDEKAEEWYDSCAKLYEVSSFDYVNFKLNMANRLDTLRYIKFTQEHINIDDTKVASAFKKVNDLVQQYVNKPEVTDYNDKPLLSDITMAIFRYEVRKQFLQNAIAEQKDCLTIQRFSGSDWDLSKISLATDKGAIRKNYLLGSKRALEMFREAFIKYFQDRFMSETDLVKIQNNIETYQNANKRLLHRLIFEIYQAFAKANKTDFMSDNDIYKIGEKRNHKYASLKSKISEWIFNLLVFMGYLDNKRDKNIMNHKNKVDYIKDKMKEHSKYKWDDFQLPKDWFYFL